MNKSVFEQLPTRIEISKKALFENIQSSKEYAGANDVIAVIKADAYGLGAINVARFLENYSEKIVSEFAVATLNEAISLRESGIQLPIWVFGAQRVEFVSKFVEFNLIVTIPNLSWLKKALLNISSKDEKIKIAVPIDTGMTRIGITKKEELKEIIEFVNQHSNVELMEIYTHFATAEDENNDYFNYQITKWHEIVDPVMSEIDPKVISVANSGTVLWHKEDSRVPFSKIRIGALISGIDPSESSRKLPFKLLPALSLFSEIVDIRQVKKGTKISYGGNYEMDEDGFVATIPIGYFDGWLRRMSQEGKVLIEDNYYPIVGNITMNHLMVRVDKEYSIGTKVVFIGKSNTKQLTISEQASVADTISYEVQTSLSSWLPRIIKD